MSVNRLSISVPAELEQTIRAAAEAVGLPISTWLAQAAERQAAEQAAVADGLAAVAEYEAEYGPIPAADRARARRALIEAGLIPAERRREAS